MRNSGKSLRYERLKLVMQREKLDAMVAVSPENVFYMAETYIETQKSLRSRLAIALLPLEAEPVMIGCVIEENTIEDETWIRDKHYYFEFRESPVRLLADAILERGLQNSRIGIELDYLSALYFNELKAYLPQTEFIPCVNLFEQVRAVKDAHEIELLAKAASCTRQAFERAVAETHIGETERTLSLRTSKHMLDLGCDKVDFLVMGTGKRSILVHALPDDSPLTDGEEGRIDFGGLFGNYNSDVARTFVIGNADVKHRDVFSRMVEVYRAAIDACRIGNPANSPYFVAKKKSEELKLPFNRVHEGHGLGLACHEHPILSPDNHCLFEEDMVMCVEHAVHVDGYRYHIEDLIRITPNGPVILSEPDFNPRLLHID